MWAWLRWLAAIALVQSAMAFAPTHAPIFIRSSSLPVPPRAQRAMGGRGHLAALRMAQARPPAVARRSLLGTMLLVLPAVVGAQPQSTADPIAKGSITVKPGVEPPSGGAVYVTARLAGKVKGFATGRELSPIASIKIPVQENQALPLEWSMTTENLTPEGAEGGKWWANQDLTLSARWDEDGNASTRGPNDLVGRATLKKGEPQAVIDLTGRGIAGKIATQKSK